VIGFRKIRTLMQGLLRALPIYFLLATSLGYVDYHMRSLPDYGYTNYVPGVIHGTEPPPGKYRVLAPYAFAAFARVLPTDRQESWVLFRWLCLLLSWVACHVLLTTWFDEGGAIAGTALTAALLPLTFTNSWPHPDHLVELGLVMAAMAAMARRVDWAFGVILVCAALNRETSAFLVLLYALASPYSRRHLVRVLVFASIWIAVYVGLRAALGFTPYNAWHFKENLIYLKLLPKPYDPYFRRYAWFIVVLVAGVATVTVRSWANQPRLVRAALVVITPTFLVTALLFSSVIETRIFTLILPMLVLGIMFSFIRPKDQMSKRHSS
jgi:hypothetical protein